VKDAKKPIISTTVVILLVLAVAGPASSVMTNDQAPCLVQGYFSFQTQSNSPTYLPDVNLNWNGQYSAFDSIGQVRSFNLLPDMPWMMDLKDINYGGGISLMGNYSFSPQQFNSLSLECYRDPIFDGNKPVPTEPASAPTGKVQLNHAIPEPFALALLAFGGALFLKNHRRRIQA
jgi:hypothetical protein